MSERQSTLSYFAKVLGLSYTIHGIRGALAQNYPWTIESPKKWG